MGGVQRLNLGSGLPQKTRVGSRGAFWKLRLGFGAGGLGSGERGIRARSGGRHFRGGPPPARGRVSVGVVSLSGPQGTPQLRAAEPEEDVEEAPGSRPGTGLSRAAGSGGPPRPGLRRRRVGGRDGGSRGRGQGARWAGPKRVRGRTARRRGHDARGPRGGGGRALGGLGAGLGAEPRDAPGEARPVPPEL
ncbi:collagen alpha-1(III) chain-like [Ochotona princeps]|uniref:collagen alpha-1(III) chain-like n=1 Tax=Ochotona princeps TaxID=9978 RepID=UPI0027145BD4|nr:collagen alpha-1(III) chain-like [Ochotona princeps]